MKTTVQNDFVCVDATIHYRVASGRVLVAGPKCQLTRPGDVVAFFAGDSMQMLDAGRLFRLVRESDLATISTA